MKIKKILGLSMAAVMAVSVLASMPASAKTSVSYSPISKTYKSDGKDMLKLSIKTPKLGGSSVGVKKINAYFKKSAKKTVKEAKKMLVAAKEQYKSTPKFFNNYMLKSSAKLVYAKKGKYSFKVSSMSYSGGAHGGSYLGGITFDKSGKKLPLSKMTKYAPADLKNKIVKATNKKIDKNPDLFFPEAKNTVLKKSLNKFDAFLKDNYLYVVYQEYELAPYAAGKTIVKVKI